MKKLNITINLLELKYRTIYSCLSFCIIFATFFEYKVELFFLISESFLSFQKYFIYTSIFDPIILYIKIVIIATLVIFFPVGLYVYSFFFIKSLYNIYIKVYTIFFLILSFFNFLLAILFFNFLIKFLLKFLLTFQRIKQTAFLQLQLEATIQQYFSLFFFLIFIFFLLFFLPIIFFYLQGLLQYFIYNNFVYRRYLYLFIISTFLITAPPDLLLQLLILPLLLFILEIYIYLIYFFLLIYDNYLKDFK